MEFKVGVFADVVDHIIYGTVIQEVKTSNIAREVSLTQSKSPSQVSSGKTCPLYFIIVARLWLTFVKV